MLNDIKQYVVGIIVFVIVCFVILLMFTNSIVEPTYSATTFSQDLESFKTCATDYEQKHELAKTIDNNEFIYLSDEELAEAYPNYVFETSCEVGFVNTEDEKMEEMAMEAYNYATKYFNTSEVGLINATYSAPSSYYAYLGEPAEYLYFAMTKDEQNIVGIVVQPNGDGTYNITPTWPYEQSGDLTTTDKYSDRLLLKYNTKVK